MLVGFLFHVPTYENFKRPRFPIKAHQETIYS